MLEAAMAETGAQARATVMIGDSPLDMAMAANAGTAAIGVAWGSGAAETLRDAGADIVVAAFGEVAAAVDRLTAPAG